VAVTTVKVSTNKVTIKSHCR